MAFAGEDCSRYAAWSHRQVARLFATHAFDLIVADRESAGPAEDLVRLVAAAQPGVPVVVMSVP